MRILYSIEALTGRMRVEVICERCSAVQQQHEGCDPVGRGFHSMEPDMVHRWPQMLQIEDWHATWGQRYMNTSRYLQNQTTARRQRHDSAWTTLQPSHESQTDDDDDALPSPPVARLAVVFCIAAHSTAANATLHPVNPRRACKCTTGARPRSTPTPTPGVFVAVIRQHRSLLLATACPRPAFCIMLPRRRRHSPADTPDDSPASTTVAANPVQSRFDSRHSNPIQSNPVSPFTFRPPVWCGLRSAVCGLPSLHTYSTVGTLPSLSTRFACNCQRPNGLGC